MRRNEKPDIRERLLLAGLKIFAAKGYGSTTVREICDVAKSNIAAVNYHFGDKAHFYQAVKDYARSQRQVTMRQCWEVIQTSPWDALRLHIGILLDNTYNSVMAQINWIFMRELLDGVPVTLTSEPSADHSEQRRQYEENMTRLLTGLLRNAASQENINLLRYTYYSICLFLPIHTHWEEKFLRGQGRFTLRSTSKESLVEYVFSIVERTVEDMRQKVTTSVNEGN